MNALASTNKQFAAWVDEECRHLDLVASWNTLVEQYDSCRFTDGITDQQRLMEFKQVIKGEGPCSVQRMQRRRQAHEDGAWVREAAAEFAKKYHGAESALSA